MPVWQRLEITDVDGLTFTLADCIGTPVLVELFATWCSNCRQQLPKSQDAAVALGDQAAVIALSVETDIDPEAVAQYAVDNDFPAIRFAVMSPELLAAFVEEFGNSAANPPSTPKIVIDAAGVASEMTTGQESTEDLVAQLTAAATAGDTGDNRALKRAMAEYVEAFTLGNAAILSNVCLLPLYPGMVVMLSARLSNPRSRVSTMGLGVAVLAGIVTFMVVIGFVLYQLSRAVADILDWLLPLIYGTVFVLGVLMLVGRNPFTRLVRTEAPVLRSPAATAYLYGLFLAPMTLPCTGPLVVSAFVIGGVSGSDALADSLVYFFFYALGFGWPLVVLPILAAPAQHQITRFLARNHRVIEVLTGLLLIGIAVYGYWTEVRPST